MNKTLQDSIVRIANGHLHRFSEIYVLRSKLVIAFLKCLYKEGFIRGFVVEKRKIKVFLKYYGGKSSIQHISSVSTLSKRVYISKIELLNLLSSKGLLIISTSKGLFTSRDVYQDNFIGGEILCKVY